MNSGRGGVGSTNPPVKHHFRPLQKLASSQLLGWGGRGQEGDRSPLKQPRDYTETPMEKQMWWKRKRSTALQSHRAAEGAI